MIQEIEVSIYTKNDQKAWNDFVLKSINAPFFFKRQYMEYHNDRFDDFSLIIKSKSKIVGVVPASINQKTQVVSSHAGLTFGGVVIGNKMVSSLFLDCFGAILDFLRDNAVKQFVYKCVPDYYHQFPAASEAYAAFKFNGNLIRRDLGSVLRPSKRSPIQNRRSRMVKKAKSRSIKVAESTKFKEFWGVLCETLKERHDVAPTHTLEEILYLHNLCPDNIRLFMASKNEEYLYGVVIYESKTVAHCQYIASSPAGRDIGALDLLIEHLISDTFINKEYFSFGVSTENGGQYLNRGLISQKEGFGARACVSDTYQFTL